MIFQRELSKMSEHLILDIYDGYFEDLNSPNFLRDIFTRAILKAEMTILNEYTHKFSPIVVTCLFALAESHVSCHTWPGSGLLNADFFTCGKKDPKICAKYIINALESEKYKIRVVKR